MAPYWGRYLKTSIAWDYEQAGIGTNNDIAYWRIHVSLIVDEVMVNAYG